MSTARALARREVTRQLTSPASWLIVGVFALLAGAAFMATLDAFLDQASQALLAPPAQPINVNQLLIRPYLLWVGLVALLMLPLITARAYAGEPHGGRAMVVATFVGTLTLYAVMLLISLALLATLFLFGAPEWGSIVSGYLGLALIGAAFISAGLVASRLATSAWPAGTAMFAISLTLVAATWLARSGTPGAQAVFRYFSAGDALDDFAKGVIDTRHIVSCLSIIALGLFLSLHAVEPQRSRN
jgi:gliding motility-associated transport system permease protein